MVFFHFLTHGLFLANFMVDMKRNPDIINDISGQDVHDQLTDFFWSKKAVSTNNTTVIRLYIMIKWNLMKSILIQIFFLSFNKLQMIWSWQI